MNAVFIGRFQPFHRGHLHAIRRAADRYDVTVGIGSSQAAGTRNNPLSFDEREAVLSNCIDLPIIGIPDQDDNEDWMRYIEEHVAFDLGVSGNDLVRSIFADHGHRVEEPDLLQPDRFEGTAIRQRIAAGEDWRDRVPACALSTLEEIGFAGRIRDIYDSDG
ncbi:MAG: adenylyltransferase/cytidyltransferase family protein [Candidatus Nanohaloarchaea archaeon]